MVEIAGPNPCVDTREALEFGPELALAFATHHTRLRVTTPHTALRTYPLEPNGSADAVCARADVLSFAPPRLPHRF